jgi:hypothetical protein
VKHFAAVWGKCVLAVTGRVENVSQEVLRIWIRMWLRNTSFWLQNWRRPVTNEHSLDGWPAQKWHCTPPWAILGPHSQQHVNSVDQVSSARLEIRIPQLSG